MAIFQQFPVQPSTPSTSPFSQERPHRSQQPEIQDPRIMSYNMETGVPSPVAPPAPTAEISSPALSTSSSITAIDHSPTPLSSVATPQIIHAAQVTGTPTYETTGFPPTLMPLSPFQTSSVTSPRWGWASPISIPPIQPPAAYLQPSQESRLVFTNPLTGQRWYSDTPLVDQSQAPRFLASSPFPTPTYRSSQNTQFTSQHPPLPLSTHVPGTPQQFIPAHPITLPHPTMINTYPTSSPQVAQPPAYNQLAPRFAPAAPLATHTELEDAPLIFSPLQGWMTMNCCILIDEQVGETGW